MKDDLESLEPLVVAYAARLDAEMSAHDAPAPDLAAVLRRAAELDPDVARVDVDEAVAHGAEHSSDTRVATLAPFVDAYRDRLDASVDAAPAEAPARSPVRMIAIATGLAAAVVVAVWGVREIRSSGAIRGDGEVAPAAAADAVERRDRSGTASQRVPLSPKPKAPFGAPSVAPMPEPAVPEAPPEPQPKAAVESLSDRIARIDAEARRAWKRGDLAAAERKFRTVTKIGGRRRAAEIAFGELFAVVRQRGGDPSAQWQAYLRRFPRGRYAADASAGLCQRAASDAREECWERYRARFPDGKHQGRP